MNNLNMVINKVSISESNSMFSLTDLHKASGGADNKRPSRFMRLERTKALISELNNDLSAVIKSDKKAGTFGCPEIVIAYAMYVSPSFEVAVIREYLKHAKKMLKLAELHGKVAWQQNRELGKLTHRDSTDTIQRFINYAAAHGSNGYPKQGYMIITKMINTALNIKDRDAINEDSLHTLATAELICENALNKGMADNLPYKTIFQQAKLSVHQFAKMVLVKDVA